MAEPPRWSYRFENFSRALSRLREAIALLDIRPLSSLEQEGLVQRFEYTWELAWKVLKDYLEDQGTALSTITPASVIKAAFAARLIEDGGTWMKALDARNRMPHTYSLQAFERAVSDIRRDYVGALQRLHDRLAGDATGTGTSG